MKSLTTNRIAEWRKRRGLTQQQLADELGAHWMTVSKLERGKMQLTTWWLEQISKALDIRLQDLMPPDLQAYEVALAGVIVDGSSVRDLPEGVTYYAVQEDLGDLVSDWYRVLGRQLEPFYFEGDFIKVTYYTNKEHHLLIGRLAAITLADERAVFAVLEAHRGANRFDLRTPTGIRFEDVPVTEVGVVTGHLMEHPKHPEIPQAKPMIVERKTND